MTSFGESAAAHFQAELLAQTVTHAVQNTELYSRLYESCNWESVLRVKDLAYLPLVDKCILRSAGRRAVANGLLVANIQNTTGTSGEPFFILRSVQELEYIEEFFTALAVDEACDNPPDSQTSSLALHMPTHGSPTTIPGKGFGFVHAITNEKSASAVVALLSHSFSDAGVNPITRISGSTTQIKLLTSVIQESARIDVTESIQVVVVTGDYLSTPIRNSLEKFWSCPVVSRFSLSEAFGGATYCDSCDGFHFDPVLVPEVVNKAGKVLDDNAAGLLAVTCLYPFVQMQPLIRYLTGDVVLRKYCTKRKVHSIQYLGRVNNSCFDNKEQLLIGDAQVSDILDKYPEIARVPETSMRSRQVGLLGTADYEIYAPTKSQNKIELHCRASCCDLLFSEQISHATERIAQELQNAHRRICTGLCECHEFNVTIHGESTA